MSCQIILAAQEDDQVVAQFGGSGGIRTHGTISGTLDFESSTFDRAMLHFQFIPLVLSTSAIFQAQILHKGKKTGKKFLSSQNHSNQKPSNHAGFALKIAV